MVRPEALPATYVMLVDSSQSIPHGVGFLRDAVTRFMRYLRPADRVLVVPFSRTIGAATGPTDDVGTVLDLADPGGGTSIYERSWRRPRERRREGRNGCASATATTRTAWRLETTRTGVRRRRDAYKHDRVGGSTDFAQGRGDVKSFAEATGGRRFSVPRERAAVVRRVAADVATPIAHLHETNQRARLVSRDRW